MPEKTRKWYRAAVFFSDILHHNHDAQTKNIAKRIRDSYGDIFRLSNITQIIMAEVDYRTDVRGYQAKKN